MNGKNSWWKSFVIAALLSTIASLLIVAVGPGSTAPNEKAKGGDSAANGNSEEAQAAQGNGGGKGSDTGTVSTTDTAAATISDDAGTSVPGNGGGNGNGGKKNDTSSTVAASSSSNGNGNGASKHGPDPDPVQTQSPPSTNGPGSCPGYSQGSGGPYDHDNCDGSQGQHGNGGNGKCAGCTGKADDKSPGGQFPGDHNNGYECDHNKGVGKGNPAHSRCANTPPPCTVDLDPTTPGIQCSPPLDCTGDTNPNNNQSCNPPPDCTGDFDPTNNGVCIPPVCPPDSDFPGQALPGGDIRNCYEEPPILCPPNSNLAGQPVPGGNVANCFTTQPPPPRCPPDTDLAGQPIPGGNIAFCDEDVLGDLIDNDGDIEGNLQERPAVQGGRVLPFTGVSIFGYLLVGLELMLVGMFAMRARRRKG